MENRLLSLFDLSGNWSQPYRENGWEVLQIDIQLGIDLLQWDYKQYPKDYFRGCLIAIPCTDYALSGAKHFFRKDNDGTTEFSNKLVNRVKEILDYFEFEFWVLENPMSRIHKLNTWLGPVVHKFNPCDYAGYSPYPDSDRYNKMTWLWGKFITPQPKRIEPHYKENPGWKLFGGKSLKTKNERSKTPLGFSYAFYEYNH